MTENKQIVIKIKSALGKEYWCPHRMVGRLLDDDNCDFCVCGRDGKVCPLIEYSLLELR